MSNVCTAAFAQAVLRHHRGFTWTTMGFGVIRTYLDEDKRWRFNVWDDRLQVANVSTIHDHPWSFTSYILAGCMNNIRYILDEGAVERGGTPTHMVHQIKTGEGGGPVEKPKPCILHACPKMIYKPGSQYYQRLDEIHETLYSRGTVSLNDRTPPTEAYTARVFWPYGTEWVDAMPRVATSAEIEAAVDSALHQTW